MSHVSTAELIEQLQESDEKYREVLTEESISVELAQYPNDAPKHPHPEDELYYIISGSGTAAVGEETFPIEEGDVIYVERGVEHDFFDIEEEITALVIFAGAEDSVLGRS